MGGRSRACCSLPSPRPHHIAHRHTMATGGTSDAMRERMAHIKHVLVVMSGKGGVGKSTVASQLALAFSRAGKRVGILDVDLCGPSIPRMTGLEGHEVHQSTQGWVPVYLDSAKTLAVMSIGFLLPSRDSAVVWRGPKKNGASRPDAAAQHVS